MHPVRTVSLTENWTLSFLESHNLGAASAAVTRRMTKGLATPEGLELAQETAIPDGVRERVFETSIPADVHMVLQEAGIIADPHRGLNEFTTQWIGRSSWKFSTRFTLTDLDDHCDLVLSGIDTVAEVYLNDRQIASSRDMHVPLILEITGHIQQGENLLEVIFVAQEDWADQQEQLKGAYPNAYTDPTNHIRKMASNFGWDWGPTLVTAGIWRPVMLISYSTRLSHTSFVSRVENSHEGHVRIVGKLRGGETGTLRILCEGTELASLKATTEFDCDVALGAVDLWWPRGYGEQPLYTLTLELLDEGGVVIDSETRTLGFRSVRIMSEPDSHGTSWAIAINNQRVWARGANWIPADTSIARVSRTHYENRIADAIAANMNILRVWGGGIFESDDFYSLCDEAGILVWQDALFACASYPEDDETTALVFEEVTHAALRLSSHPSLVVWNGSNENIWGYFDWGWKEELSGRNWGLTFYTQTIPDAIHQIDTTRPYQPSSPWSGSMDIHPNDPHHGTAHLWEPWNRQDYPDYLSSVPRFVTEYGYQSPAAWSTLAEALGVDQLSEDSPGLRAHQKAFDGKAKLRRALELRFGQPRDFDDWHFLTQLEHARALELAIHHLRSHHEICAGSVIWQLNDCWPAVSWSLVDVNGVRKPAWFAVRRAYDNILVTLQGDHRDLTAVLVNDTDKPRREKLTLEVFDASSQLRDAHTVDLEAAPHGVARAHISSLLSDLNPREHFVRAEAMGRVDYAFFAVDKDLALPAASYRIDVSEVPQGVELVISAHSVVRDICLTPDRRDAHAQLSENFFTLVAGETKTVTIETLKPSLFLTNTWSDMIRSANDQVRTEQ
jgi:beta-mannosidase